MAQHDYTIANQGFPATRSDINNVLSAISTNNSGTSAPSTQYAGQFWIDTTSSTWTMYIHDGADDIPFATIDTSANTVNFTDSALDVVTDTTPQLGGDLDLNSNDITGTGNINITGTIQSSGNITGTLATASQPNITSVGTLTSFTSTGIDDNATSTAVTIDSSDNVGIGTTSPSVPLDILTNLSSDTQSTPETVLSLATKYASTSSNGASGSGSRLEFQIPDDETNPTTGSAIAGLKENADDSNSSSALAFYISQNDTTLDEAMRIESDGDVLINATSSVGTGKFQSANNSGYCSTMYSIGNNADYIQFWNGSEVGSIKRSGGTGVSYNTSSDYRLKENVSYDFDATTRLKQLKPARFNFIADADTTVDGFLAHEVSSVVPEAITGTKDAVDENGTPEYQGIDQSKLVPLLVKTIQELEARITILENS